MATPALVTDGSDIFQASVMNRAINGDGTVTGIKCWHGRVLFDGANSVVEPTFSSAGLATPGVAFVSGSTEWQFTLSGFTLPPVIIMTPFGDTAYYAKVLTTSNVLATIAFYDVDTGAKIITMAEDTDMDQNVIIMGA